MKFKLNGTKVILEPSDKSVEAQYLARPEKYIPVSLQKDSLASLSPDELKAYAADRRIDIGNATSVNGIIKKIREAEANAAGQ